MNNLLDMTEHLKTAAELDSELRSTVASKVKNELPTWLQNSPQSAQKL